MIARRLLIRGRVQGVFYRNWAVATARGLALSGWVRNRRNGDVEAFAHGAESAVDAFIQRCREGPPAARVEDVIVEAAEPEASSAFEKRPTA